MYSSGNNTISGAQVGIGISNPQASLHLKDYSGISMSGTMTYMPLIRLQSTNPNILPVTTNFWDFTTNAQSSLTFSHHTSQNTNAIEALRLGANYVKVFDRLKVGSFGEYGATLTPDNTQGYGLSLGLKELGTGAWQGHGAAMFTTSSGEFQLMTNHTSGVVNGASSMLNNLRFSINETNAYFSTPVRIGGSYGDVNILTSPYKLYVQGGIRTEQVVVDYYNTWYDFVFEKEYDLMSIADLKLFVKTNKHLPEVPSEKEVRNDGLNLADMNAVLLQKVEELTLYIFQLEERLGKLETNETH